MDFEAPRLRAGVSGTLLRVEAADTLSGIAGVYVNDELYTTLQNGEFSVRIDKNTRDSHFYIMGVDNAGNRTGYLVIANPSMKRKRLPHTGAAQHPLSRRLRLQEAALRQHWQQRKYRQQRQQYRCRKASQRLRQHGKARCGTDARSHRAGESTGAHRYRRACRH